jgi:hypothetical protein
MVQFDLGYLIMLLAMYYNGYIIICILLGAFVVTLWRAGMILQQGMFLGKDLQMLKVNLC